MNIPYARLAWITAGLFVPAAVCGWLSWSAFGVWFGLALFGSLVATPLSFADKGQHSMGGCLAFVGLSMLLLVTTVYTGMYMKEPWFYDWEWLLFPLAGVGYYLLVALVVALANPEGLTLLMIAAHAMVAGGVALGLCSSHRLAWALVVPALTFVAGVAMAIVRSALKRRSSQIEA